MDNTPLGLNMHFHSFALSGVLPVEQWRQVLADVTEAIGMHPAYHPAIWDYPLCGAGGTGQTIVQPITESFLALDVWPDHTGAYLLVCSCRRFDPATIRVVLDKWGLQLGSESDHVLRIPRSLQHEQADPLLGL